MAENKNRKRPHSGPHSEARKKITERNALRRAKRYEKWLAKRQAINQALREAGPENPKVKVPRRPKLEEVGHVIRLHADGSIHGGLTVEQAMPDAFHCFSGNSMVPKVSEDVARITFLTPKGKKWTLKFSEFSFLINHRPAKPDEKEAA